jgi:putative pyruvate formate lyase activating enzyme
MLSSTELNKRAEAARDAQSHCNLCPRRCGANRNAGEPGFCGADSITEVASHTAHHGEEPPISGTRGSGAIFFNHCTMRCVYCQNYPISQLNHGRDTSASDLAGMMLQLQRSGCHNINLVTPTHYVAQILEALALASADGLDVPIVYNTSGYESLETLALLDGVVDIYLPDMRYADSGAARAYSTAPDYPAVNKAAIKEMHRQVGALQVDGEGIARRGLIVRHLVLPDGLAGTAETARFIAAEISPDTHVSLMSQYFPAHRATEIQPLDRKVTPSEYNTARALLDSHGITNGWVQPLDS